jgi:tetratricopeptide (TPR) repeat protein
MNYATKILILTPILAWLTCSTLFAQESPQQLLEDALVQEQHGQCPAARLLIDRSIESGQLSSVELGRAQILLGFAYRTEGSLIAAENSFDRALQILERDPDHRGDYASALENYAGLYADSMRPAAARRMWKKALQLRLELGEHGAATSVLLNLAGIDLSKNRLREARRLVDEASKQMSMAHDLVDDDRIYFLETDAWLQQAEGNISAAMTEFRNALELCTRVHGIDHWLTGWEYILLGKAHFQAGETDYAMADMQEGLGILDQKLGDKNLKYLWAQLAYSQVLDRSGQHAEAARLKATTDRARKDLYGNECPGCTINVAGFR